MAARSNIDILHRLIYHGRGRRSFDRAKEILMSDHGIAPESWPPLLEAIGTEESYQRCCDTDHAYENILYALYEMVLRVSRHETIADLRCWEDAVGLAVDGCFACADSLPPLSPMGDGRYQLADRLVLCTGDTGIVVENNLNIYLCSRQEALSRSGQEDLSSLLPFCAGAVITEIAFEHNEVRNGNTGFRQPVIILTFDNGARLRFSTNFGEVEKSLTATYLQITAPAL